ncbi:uncharacterized protein [Chlorocebus sabaeus]|uniref:Macaca fascicularis brain cDNA clone: QflA-19351, similar to human PR domain containing 7 (PRDM7), mRNA, RefSeq: NM_052996.2 n=1 Tax=Macaca fascicularis TaxID=9541 RepID=I7GN33_MACFA|nr:unnamed protein product [Macaca fascicularis]
MGISLGEILRSRITGPKGMTAVTLMMDEESVMRVCVKRPPNRLCRQGLTMLPGLVLNSWP